MDLVWLLSSRDAGTEAGRIFLIYQLNPFQPVQGVGRFCLPFTNTLACTPSEKLEWKYSELSNFHKIWNVIHDSKYQIEEKLGSEMF